MVWKNKNTHKYFVEIQHSNLIDAVKDHISLFNIKTVTNVF